MAAAISPWEWPTTAAGSSPKARHSSASETIPHTERAGRRRRRSRVGGSARRARGPGPESRSGLSAASHACMPRRRRASGEQVEGHARHCQPWPGKTKATPRSPRARPRSRPASAPRGETRGVARSTGRDHRRAPRRDAKLGAAERQCRRRRFELELGPVLQVGDEALRLGPKRPLARAGNQEGQDGASCTPPSRAGPWSSHRPARERAPPPGSCVHSFRRSRTMRRRPAVCARRPAS